MAQAGTKPPCPVFTVPPKFTIKQVSALIGMDFEISDSEGKLGSLIQRTWRLKPTFEIQNAEGQKIATAKERFFKLSTAIDVYDCNGDYVGSLKKTIMTSLVQTISDNKVITKYAVYNDKGDEVAESKKTEVVTAGFNLVDREGRIVAQIDRNLVQTFGDSWEFSMGDVRNVDPILLLAVPAFKTLKDQKKAKK